MSGEEMAMSQASTETDGPSAEVFKASTVDWTKSEPGPGTASVTAGVTRRTVVRNASGFFVQEVKMPPHHVIRPHSHSKSEFVSIRDGSLQLGDDGAVLEAGDAIAIPAGTVYGFKVGREGVWFMIVRAGEAELTVAG
jgi:quercetin dioxygenase-like cupin family protein